MTKKTRNVYHKCCKHCRQPFNTDIPCRKLCSRCRNQRHESHGGVYSSTKHGKRYKVGTPSAYRSMLFGYFEATKTY